MNPSGGAEGRQPAECNGRCEIIEGENLRYLRKQRLDLDILIRMPTPSQVRAERNPSSYLVR